MVFLFNGRHCARDWWLKQFVVDSDHSKEQMTSDIENLTAAFFTSHPPHILPEECMQAATAVNTADEQDMAVKRVQSDAT